MRRSEAGRFGRSVLAAVALAVLAALRGGGLGVTAVALVRPLGDSLRSVVSLASVLARRLLAPVAALALDGVAVVSFVAAPLGGAALDLARRPLAPHHDRQAACCVRRRGAAVRRATGRVRRRDATRAGAATVGAAATSDARAAATRRSTAGARGDR